MKTNIALCLLLGLVSSATLSRAQQTTTAQAAADSVPPKIAPNPKFKHESFTFVRVQYNQTGPARVRSRWKIDYPDAELNLMAHFQKETGLKCEKEGKTMLLTNSELGRYPFIYIVEAGRMELSEAEVESLRQYMLNGGFLMVDDFWGEREWKSLETEMKRVFPDRKIVELPIQHPIFHCYYDIREKPQVPNVALGIQSKHTGITWERPDAKEPHYRGIVDDKGRLMAIFCHNTDLGDGWEGEKEDAYYYKEFSAKKAFPMGINILVYVLTR
jgi:hypothetical protein